MSAMRGGEFRLVRCSDSYSRPPSSPVAHSAECLLLVCGLAHGLGVFRQSTLTENSLGPQATGSEHGEEFPVLSVKQLCHVVVFLPKDRF